MSRKFSERLGLVVPRNSIQREAMDDRLANRAWSLIHLYFFAAREDWVGNDPTGRLLYYFLWDDFFGRSVDQIPDYSPHAIDFVRKWYFGSEWNEKYDLIQFLADLQAMNAGDGPTSELRHYAQEFVSATNKVLENEKAAYRFVGDALSEITDKHEIAEIEGALSTPGKYAGAKAHISSSLGKYSDREAPDYRNSVKESISAVESAFAAFNGEKKKNMAAALSAAEAKGLVLHPALRSGILNLYGWTSDEDGVRHALLDGDNGVTEHEARLMLVLCSAFVNYVASKFR